MTEEIQKYDINFNEAMFLSKVDHIFIMILDAIMERDLSTVKHYLNEEVYNKYNEIVQGYLNSGKIRLFDEMNVKSTSIENVNVTDTDINVTVLITSRYMDYFINEDGDYLSGTNDHRLELDHRIVFTKKREVKELKEARRCTSCGHTLDINASGVCPYCNNIIDMSKFDYIVTQIGIL